MVSDHREDGTGIPAGQGIQIGDHNRQFNYFDQRIYQQGADVPVNAAALSPGAVFTAVGLGSFTGRKWLAAEVDRFMSANPCGYVFIEAEAGLGKTAFASWLVKTRGYLSHFSRYAQGTSVPAALGNLSAQLIMRFGLDDQAPGGMLPEWARTPGGFESLLAAAACAPRQAPVVIVVDGLDEADAPAGCLPFGLPLLLPEGVFVVGTYRTGRSPQWPDAPATVLLIAKDDARNRDDIDEYLASESAEEVLAEQLARAGADPARFADLLAQRCGGVWVYLRYVLQELRIGLLRPDEIDGLPSGLRNYYAAQVRRWQEDPAWPNGLLPVLATLGVTREAVTAASLARLSGSDPASVRRWCDLTLRPLLAATPAPSPGQPLRYEIYHDSFRELVNGSLDGRSGSPDHQPYELLALADELRQATAAAHDRIGDAFLSCFGGLDAGLPVLARDPGAAAIDDGYPLRHLAFHLSQARRAPELHGLLATEQTRSEDHAVNTWFAAHDHADGIMGYLSDVGRARGDGAAATDSDLTAGRNAPSLGLEIRYALMGASITGINGNVSASLVGELVGAGVWSSRRGLDHALRIVDPRDRLDCLLAVRGHLEAADQADVLVQALAAANAITSDDSRAEALAALASRLPAAERPAVLAQALAAAANASAGSRAGVLTALAPHLPSAERPAVLTQALAAANAMPALGSHKRALALSSYVRVLATLAPQLPEAERPAVLAKALAAANAMPTLDAHARALAALIPQLPEAERPDMLAHALRAAVRSGEDDALADALAAQAGQTPEDERPPLLGHALAHAVRAATGIYSPVAEPLAALAPQVPDYMLTRALARIIDTTNEGEHDRARALALATLAPYLPDDVLARRWRPPSPSPATTTAPRR
jgi:hypothetical protein